MEIKLKGVFFNSIVNVVKKHKGSEGVKELEKYYGNTLDFSSVKEFPRV